MKKLRKNVFYLIILALLMVCGFFSMYSDAFKEKMSTLPTEDAMKIYRNDKPNLSFKYPDNYVLIEKNIPKSGEIPEYYSIELVQDTPGNRDLLSGNVPNGEGPVSITFQIFKLADKNIPLLKWVTENPLSNFNLLRGTYHVSTVGGREKLFYTTDGLYMMDNIVVKNKNSIILNSVSYNSPKDSIRDDFDTIVSSMVY